MKTNLFTAIIILNYNTFEDTINCVESVERYNTTPIKYIVVDNGSSREGVVDSLDRFFKRMFCDRYLRINVFDDVIGELPRMTFLISKNNSGYAGGNNKGLKLADSDNSIDKILVLNNDILFVQDIIPGLIEDLDSLKDCGIVSPILYKRNLKDLDYNCARTNVTVWQMIYKNFFFYLYVLLKKKINSHNLILLNNKVNIGKEIMQIELPSGSCMLIRKDLFKHIGYFDSRTFLYYEENILYKKLLAQKKINYLDTRYKCIHLGASSTRKSPSLFIFKKGRESAWIYVRYYSGCSVFMRCVYKLSACFINIIQCFKFR